MDIDKLFKLSKLDTEASKRAAEGFKDRLKEHERVFAEQYRKLTPTADYYTRTYDI